MQITIKQPELEKAISDYLRSVGITGGIQEMSFLKGRAEGALVTTVEVKPFGSNIASIKEREGETKQADRTIPVAKLKLDEPEDPKPEPEKEGVREKAGSGKSIFT